MPIMAMSPSRVFTVSIDCPPDKVSAFVLNPENLPKWAATFVKSVKNEGGKWVAQTAQGPAVFRFAERNSFGILDHHVEPAPGVDVYVPMRVVPNGSGSELTFTLFRMPGMTEERFANDAKMVESDLATLKNILEKKPS